MSKSLYDKLGVQPDATEGEIKDAYRRAAKDTHPDTGGDQKAFEEINTAYLVLSKPASRKRYDETGDIDGPEPDNADTRAMSNIAGALEAFLEQDKRDPATIDLPKAITEMFEKNIAMQTDAIKKAEKAKARLERIHKRFKRKNPGANLFHRLIQHKMQGITLSIIAANEMIADCKRAIEILADYEFDVEVPKPPSEDEMLQAFARSIRGAGGGTGGIFR